MALALSRALSGMPHPRRLAQDYLATDRQEKFRESKLWNTSFEFWKMLGADHPMEAHKVDSKGIYERGKSADVKEGVIAFLEKRPAKFPMKVSSGMPSYFPWWKERTFK